MASISHFDLRSKAIPHGKPHFLLYEYNFQPCKKIETEMGKEKREETQQERPRHREKDRWTEAKRDAAGAWEEQRHTYNDHNSKWT